MFGTLPNGDGVFLTQFRIFSAMYFSLYWEPPHVSNAVLFGAQFLCALFKQRA